MYGGDSAFEERKFKTVVNGKIVSGVADDVAVIGGKKNAIEAKFVNDWGRSLRNPASPSGSKPWSVDAKTDIAGLTPIFAVRNGAKATGKALSNDVLVEVIGVKQRLLFYFLCDGSG